MTPAFSAALAGLSPQQKGRGWVARCPAHEDNAPSLRVDEADGKTLVKCHAGCDTRDVIQALGLSMTDLFEPEPAPAAPLERREVASYDYRAEDGTLLFQVVRYEPKGFTQRRPLPDGRWAFDLEGVDRVPYRLPEVVDATEVIVVEGEKDADRLVAEGFTATTSPSGANNWRHEYARYFGGKSVVVIPDNDKAGQGYLQAIVDSLTGVAAKVRLVTLPGLTRKGGDVSDWFDMGHTADELRRLLDDRVALKYERMGDIEVVEDAPMALEPFILDEGPTLIFGDGGTGKSALVLALAASFATGREILPAGVPTITGPVMWLDYESQRRESARRLHRLGYAEAPILYVPGTRPIHEDVDRLTAIAEAEGVGLVVVDSVVLAVGGSVSPNDAESPTLYARAVAAIAPRSIGLAHVVKANEADERKPFGSGFWHNVARLTWHIKKDESQPGHNVILTCRKQTGGDLTGKRLSLTFDWADGGLRLVDGPTAVTVADQIERVLAAESPLSAAIIGARLNPSKSGEHVRVELKRHPDLFTCEVDPNGLYKWRLL